MAAKTGFTDEELKGTWMAQVKCVFSSEQFRHIIKPEDYNDDKQIFKGETFEMDSHITLGMKLKEPSAQLERKINAWVPFTSKIIGVDRFQNLNQVYDDGSVHNYNVILFKLDMKELEKLHKMIMNDSGEEWKHENYTAHLTLCYTKPLTPKRWQEYKTQIESLLKQKNNTMPVKEVIFKKFRDRTSEPRVFKLEGQKKTIPLYIILLALLTVFAMLMPFVLQHFPQLGSTDFWF